MTEFWRRKIVTYFAAIDVKGKGSLSKKDAEDLADNLTAAKKASPALRALTKKNFVAEWRKYMQSAKSNDDGLLTADILVASLDQQKNTKKFKNTYLKLLHDFFRVADLNGDGYLTEAEIVSLFAGMGVKNTSFVSTAFGFMDVNGDGKVSVYEYATAMVEYLTTESYHLLWGPLIE